MKKYILFFLNFLLLTEIANAQYVGINTDTPLSPLDVNGKAFFRGANSNSLPSQSVGGVEFFMGRNANGDLPAGAAAADLSFNWAGNGGGFRHFITTRHTPGLSADNSIDFHINRGTLPHHANAPATIYTPLAMSVTGTGVSIPGNLTLGGSLNMEARQYLVVSLPFSGIGGPNGVIYQDPGFFKDKTGMVHLQGDVSGGGTAGPNDFVFLSTLPVGYRPSHMSNFIVYFENVYPHIYAVVRIWHTGQIYISKGNPGGIVSLDGVSFRPAD